MINFPAGLTDLTADSARPLAVPVEDPVCPSVPASLPVGPGLTEAIICKVAALKMNLTLWLKVTIVIYWSVILVWSSGHLPPERWTA